MLKYISLAKLLRDVLSTRSDLFSKDLATDHAQRMEKYLKSVAAFHPHPTTATFQFECVRTKQSITKVLNFVFPEFSLPVYEGKEKKNIQFKSKSEKLFLKEITSPPLSLPAAPVTTVDISDELHPFSFSGGYLMKLFQKFKKKK